MSSPLDLSLDILEFDPQPIFVVRIGSELVDFEILYSNAAFRTQSIRDAILEPGRNALLFRTWTLALGDFKANQEFASHLWSAVIAGQNSMFKIVRAVSALAQSPTNPEIPMVKPIDDEPLESVVEIRTPIHKQTPQELDESKHGRTFALQPLPHANIKARWESIQRMMDMSDVGVFEYGTEGKLIHANEAWYRLSSHPKNLPAHVEYSFMDLVYPEDQALVLSMWNTLSQGNPVTFEMRWKPQINSKNAVQWVLSACVPVFDDEGKLVSIAGNTIDINAQKKSQEAAQARVEALEQARLSEMKFARFAQLSPTAIFIFVPDIGMQFVNDQFYELTGHASGPIHRLEWFDLIADEDVGKVQDDWVSMLKGNKSDGVQFRLKKTWVNQDGLCSNIWVQSSSYPQVDDGKVISIMGTLFDISQFKWAESVQRRRIDEALEAKRQQENFIDMTSHELRNPLSAVVQCADSVIGTLQQLSLDQLTGTSGGIDSETVKSEIDTSIDALQTVVSCSLHQKRVIDDVLTLSKLDSNLILITPTRVQPTIVVSDAMKLFDVECTQTDIELEFIEDQTYKDIDWVMLDPSRLLQVLINLLTNAIKFTKDRPTRLITVRLGASWTRPANVWEGVIFTNGDEPEKDVLANPDWGSGRNAYIWLKVTDTGCGMTDAEQTKLFSRFSQATPRTHVKYGGSGLGLFISKSLAILQGGAIGVHSEDNVGSTFAFYVSTRIAKPPAGLLSAARPAAQRTISTEDAMRSVKLNVLIVEDNLVNQKVLTKQLQKFGWTISVAGNGEECLAWLRNSVYWHEPHIGQKNKDNNNLDDGSSNGGSRPASNASTSTTSTSTNAAITSAAPRHSLDIILMDIEMPIMDGLTCTREIRALESRGLLVPPRPPTPPSSPSPLAQPTHKKLHAHLQRPLAPFRTASAPTVSPITPSHDPTSLAVHAPASTPTPTPTPTTMHSPTSRPPHMEKSHRRLPILAVSANARSEQVEQALRAGMDDAISKPFRIPELWPRVKALVAKAQEG